MTESTGDTRDVLTPREVAERAGFSYHSILRAIRRGDLKAFEPVAGQYRIAVSEYEQWLRTPLRRELRPAQTTLPPRRRHLSNTSSERGSYASLRAIEGN